MSSAAQTVGLTRASSKTSLHSDHDTTELVRQESSQSRGLAPQNLQPAILEVQQKANINTYVAITVAMTGALMFGIDQGNYGIAAEFDSFYDFWCKPPLVERDFACRPGLDSDAIPQGWVSFKAWGGSLITLGAAAGCILVGPVISSNLGRRPCISAGGLICFTGCLFASYLTFGSVSVYYCGRFATGFGVGISCFALPLYSSEVATPSIRGMMGSLFQLMVVIGGVFASLLLKVISDWRMGMLLPGFAGVVVGAAIWLLPESPHFVMDKYGYAAGVEILQRVRNGDVKDEACLMRTESEAEKAAGVLSYAQLFEKPELRHRVFVACYMQVAQQLTGVNAFLSYTTNIFHAAGIKPEQVTDYNVCFNLLMLGGVVAGLMFIDSPFGGRRSQLLAATVVMGPPLIIAGMGMLIGWAGKNGGASWVPLVALALYAPAFQFAWGIVPWIYPAEIFAMNEKDKALSLATFIVFALNFVINEITPHLLNMSSGGTFVFFGLLNVTNFLFVFWFVKETKGVPLEEVPLLFEGARPVALAEKANIELVGLNKVSSQPYYDI